MKLLGMISVGFDVRSNTAHAFCIHQILKKKWEYSETVHQLFVDFKKAYDSVTREVLYNILIESGVPATTRSREIHKLLFQNTHTYIYICMYVCVCVYIRISRERGSLYDNRRTCSWLRLSFQRKTTRHNGSPSECSCTLNRKRESTCFIRD
jgi:hypothetical protein